MKFVNIAFPAFVWVATAPTAIALDHDVKETKSVVYPGVLSEEEFDQVAAAFHLSSELARQPYLRSADQTVLVSSSVSGRDKEWLDSHNSRRKKYQEDYGVSYVPLKWSSGLADEAQDWANTLAKNCETKSAKNNFGQNIAGSSGTRSLASTESILNRWMRKAGSGQMTQVLWKATHYVGCADSTNSSGRCSSSVCFYAKPGNCNLGKYSSWEKPTFADDSLCTPECPPDGCK